MKYRSFLIGFAILLFGVAGLVALIVLKSDPPREEPPDNIPVVETIHVMSESGSVSVRSNGIVQAARMVNLSAEVPGQIVSVSPRFVTGGAFKKGEVLLQIEPFVYQNAVAVATADVTQRQLEVLLAEEEASIARDEWDRLKERYGEEGEPPTSALGSLVLREPQLKLSEAALMGSEARLEDAKYRLARTEIRAPFNGRISTRTAEVGQFVGPGGVVASFYGTDVIEIPVSLTSSEAALMKDFYATDGDSTPRPARVKSTFAPENEQWEGYVHRVEGALDELTRTLRVIVRVDAPYVVRPGGQPLLIGSFADVEIEGRVLDHYFSIPRDALREGNQVWIYENETLSFQNVSVVQVFENTVLVEDGLEDGDQLITTRLPIVVDGMQVRHTEEIGDRP